MTLQKIYRPKRGVFESTLACNLKCRHCGSSAGAAREDELTTQECKSLFEQLRGIGLEWLTISGGEPLTRKDWAELIRLAKNTGMGVGMFTNAIALDDDAVRRAKDAGIDTIGLSIDGLEATHDMIRGKKGHFKILEAAMERLKKHDIAFGAVTTICSDNISQLEEMQKYIAGTGAYSWQVQLGSDMGNLSHHPEMLISPKQLPKLEKRIADMIVSGPIRIHCADSLGYFGPHEKILRSSIGGHCWGGCGAGKSNIGIECNGNIKGCLSIMAGYNSKGQDYVEGNIREASLEEIWNRPGAFGYNREWSRQDLTGFCASCDYAERCKGGCLGKRVSDGNLTENPMCVYRVLMESSQEPRKLAQAAAVFFALALGASNAACDDVDDSGVGTDTETSTDADSDADSDSDTDTDTDSDADSDSDTDTDSDTDSDSDSDTDSDTDSDSDADTNTTLYGIQPDTEVDTSVDKYGILPPYSLPPDTEDTASYDTETQTVDTTPVAEYAVLPPDSDTRAIDTSVDLYGVLPLYAIQPGGTVDTGAKDKKNTDTSDTMLTWYGINPDD